MFSNITKTIQDSLEEFEKECCEVHSTVIGGEVRDILYLRNFLKGEMNLLPTAQELKSHLLQSQIRLIEVWIANLVKDKIHCEETKEFHEGEYGFLCGSCKDVRAYNHALEDQISSLNETLEFLKKSL